MFFVRGVGKVKFCYIKLVLATATSFYIRLESVVIINCLFLLLVLAISIVTAQFVLSQVSFDFYSNTGLICHHD